MGQSEQPYIPFKIRTMERIHRVFFRDSRWLDRPLANCQKALDVGAGGFRRGPNVVTMDVLPLPNTDIVTNVEQYPWPFAENTFDYVILGNVFEHIEDLHLFMRELARVTKPGGIVRGITPHFTSPCTYADATHKHAISLHIFDYYCVRKDEPFLLNFGKKLLGCDIAIGKQFGEALFIPRRLSLYFREILWLTLAPLWGNWFQDFFEVYASKFLPAWAVYFELEVNQKQAMPIQGLQ